jgi:hypothetical protein
MVSTEPITLEDAPARDQHVTVQTGAIPNSAD